MNTDAESVLRDKLKVALQDARRLYDDGLLDDTEFKDLKAHELSKYKEQLAVLTASAISRAIEKTPPEKPREKLANVTPICTPLNERLRQEALRPSPNSAPVPSSPQTMPRLKRPEEDTIYVDSSVYRRLTTPPIFRRRQSKPRKIVIPCSELKALQARPEKKSQTSR